MNWPWRKTFAAVPQPSQAPGTGPLPQQRPFPGVMSLADWHRSAGLVESARTLFDTALWQKMLGVLYNGLPLEYLRRPGATPTDVARALGRIEGYVDCMNLLQSLGIAPAQSVDIPTTWGAPAQGEAINE